ncbi:hypothetical protein Tco_1450036 [Tanacetum coccineum]
MNSTTASKEVELSVEKSLRLARLKTSLSMPRDDPIIERIPRRSLKKRNITPSKNELPHIGSNVAFEENMISRFNIGIARRTRDGRNIHTTRREIQSMREPVQGKPSHKHIDLPGDNEQEWEGYFGQSYNEHP